MLSTSLADKSSRLRSSERVARLNLAVATISPKAISRLMLPFSSIISKSVVMSLKLTKSALEITLS